MTQRLRRANWAVAVSCALVATALSAVSPVFGLDPKTPVARYGHDVWQDALPQNTVHTVLQTRDGYLWLGTYEGLVRFNGVEFTVFDKSNTPAIRNNGMRALYEDRAGTLWVGTASAGLLTYRDGVFKSWTTEQGLASNFVYALAEDQEGGVWAGTTGGLSRFLDGSITNFTIADGMTSDRVRSLCAARDGSLWIGTDGGGLLRYVDGRFVAFTSADGLPAGVITTIREDHAGAIWLGTDGAGVGKYAGGTFTRITAADGLPSDRISALWEDRQNCLWIGTDGGGLARYFDGRFQVRSIREGLSDAYVRALWEDREGSLWIGTNGGLNRLKEGKFVAWHTRDGLSTEYTRVVCEGEKGIVWIGTDGGGINRLEGSSITSMSRKTGFPSDFVRALWPNPGGGVWAGTVDAGLFLITDTSVKRYTTADGLPSNDIRAIWAGSDGDVWIATGGDGVARMRSGTFESFGTKDGIGSNDVRAVIGDGRGGVWIGTNGGGVSYFDGRTWTTTRVADGLAGDVVFSILPDAEGRVWVGSSDGLSVRIDGEWRVLTTAEGLYDDLAFSLLEDGDGKLWMSCNKGVYRAEVDDLVAVARGDRAQVRCVAYGREDGMGSTQCNGASQPAGWRGRDGRLWFPTVAGVSVVDPSAIKLNDIPPPVIISKFVVDGESRPRTDGAELPARSGRFEFHYDGLSFLVPEKVRFRYRLEGIDDEWIDAGSRRVAYYNPLPAGEYTFRVQAANNDGVWNEAGASMRFTLPPPMWWSWWAIGLYALAIGGAIYGAHRLRILALRRRTDLLETEVTSRTEALARSERRALEASRAKSTFLANMSHELRTPMNAILGFVQLMQRDRGLSGEQRENLSIVERSGEHLLALINDVLSISKIEAGHITLNVHAFDLPRMLDGLRDTFRLRAEAKDLTFDVEVGRELPRFVRGDEGKVRQILINLLGNAFKFTEEGGVVLRATWEEGRAYFDVEDTGPGIGESDIDKVFGAFVQSESGRTAQEGTGLGLAISRSFARLMSGDITADSSPGVGTTFRVTVALPATAETGPHPVERQVISLEPGQSPVRILVVDDTLENRKLLVKLLSSVGFYVREAVNGREAVEHRMRWHPHLIWMDIRMPVMDGVSATREIRRLEAEGVDGEPLTPVKVIALTASVFDHEHGTVMDGGCDDLVTKPFKESTIFEKLGEHLGVTFVYERTGRTGPLEPADPDAAPVLTPSRMAALPRELVVQLAKGVQVGDLEAIHATINRICDCDEPLGNRLRELARRYQFEEILETVDRASGNGRTVR